jgi:hypothetical protein
MDEAPLGAPTRRHLLAAVGLAMVGTAANASVGLGSSQAGTIPVPRLPASLHDAEMAGWQAIVGRSFRISGGGRVRLVAVEPLPSTGRRPRATRPHGFAAIFETLPGALDGDRTYRLSNALLPPVHVHFGPAIAARGKARHIAVFN